MRVDIVTIFPELLRGVFDGGVIGAARKRGLIAIQAHDLRDHTDAPHRQVDDRPYGGGPGMVLKPEPLYRAVEALRGREGDCRVVLTSARGRRFDQAKAKALAQANQMIVLCGRYEGVDERVLEVVDEELSIGDYVLSGGELPAAVIAEAVCRLVPGVVGDAESVQTDSFYAEPLLGPPQYTRPPEFRGLRVPEVLLRGDHDEINSWRRERSLEKTLGHRPDLLARRDEDARAR